MLPDFKLTLRPNNQITLSIQNTIKRLPTYCPNKPLDGRLSDDTITRFVRREAAKFDLETYYSKDLKHECLSTSYSKVCPVPLDLIKRFQQTDKVSSKEKLGYGKTPRIKYFSYRSGQKLRESGAIIDRLCGSHLDRCRVVTLTIPSSEISAFKAISDYSGYAVNRLFQLVRRDYKLSHWFYVYEHQKRGALHLHICVYHLDPEISKEIGEKLCSKWRDVLADISERSGVNLLFSRGFNRVCDIQDMQLDNQSMRLGCGAYFSKYASKTSGRYVDDINSVNARKYPPSSFWGRSRELSRMCDEYSYSIKYEGQTDIDSESLQIEALQILSQFKIVLSHSFAFKKEIELSERNGSGTLTICEGFSQVFYVSPDDYQILLQVMSNHFDVYKPSSTLDKRRSLV